MWLRDRPSAKPGGAPLAAKSGPGGFVKGVVLSPDGKPPTSATTAPCRSGKYLHLRIVLWCSALMSTSHGKGWDQYAQGEPLPKTCALKCGTCWFASCAR